ncbi:Uncharacterized protein Rs2_21401 [Raphanus sativus]|nr:Uncharacterized protein Rs2_21401 [Raphanus sativus]
MLDFVNCEIGKYGKFRNFFLKCVNVGNMNAVYYEGLHLSMKCGLEEGIQVLEANVPNHGMSTLALGIFNVCLGKDIEASQIFQEFEVKHADLRSEALIGMGDQLEFQLSLFDAPYLNSYASTFKYPEDDVIQSPVCIYNHDYTIESKGLFRCSVQLGTLKKFLVTKQAEKVWQDNNVLRKDNNDERQGYRKCRPKPKP